MIEGRFLPLATDGRRPVKIHAQKGQLDKAIRRGSGEVRPIPAQFSAPVEVYRATPQNTINKQEA
jgi:hypothetical protein